MDITPENLALFATWLRDNGRADPTIDLYPRHVRLCGAAPSLTSRLVDKEYAPKSRHVDLAALRSWADFSNDPELLARLKRIKLPPAVRVTPKVELALDEWRRIVLHLQQCDIAPAMKSTLLIMAKRGLRSGDVLRIQRKEVLDAIRTNILAFEGKGGRRMEFDATPIKTELEAFASAKGPWKRVRDLVGGDAQARSTSNRVRRELERQAKKCNVRGLHPHRLRRTYATYFLKRLDRDPQALIKLTSHMAWSNIATAASYVDAVDVKELNSVGEGLIADLMKESP